LLGWFGIERIDANRQFVMFEIHLIRHGKPQCDHSTRIRGCEFAKWVAGYDDAPIDRNCLPAPELLASVTRIPCLATSTLRRSIESASILARPGTARGG
jgi:broad specificity phosphatase PhoE